METKQGYFNPTMPRSLDDRFYKATQADILNIPIGARYVGMEIYAYQEDVWYQYKNGVQDTDLVESERGGGGPAIENRYADTTALLADQANQTAGGIQFVLDASGDTEITTGWAYYDYLEQGAGTVAGDYRRISSEEELSAFLLQNGKGTTVRDGDKVDIGGGDLIDANATVGVGAGADFRIENPSDALTNKYTNRIRIQDNYGWQLRRRNDNTGNRGTLLMESWNAGADGEVIDIVGNNQETGAIAGLQVRRDGLLHVGDIWSAAATAGFLGLKYRANYPNIDWAGDTLLIPHQARVIEIGTEQGWGVDGTPDYNALTEVTLTVSSQLDLTGVAQRQITVAANSGTVGDLDEIVGLPAGQTVMLYAKTGHTITVRHSRPEPQNIILVAGEDVVLSEDNPMHIISRAGTSNYQVNSLGASGETIQSITINEASKTTALALDADANVIEITLAADLTSPAKPSGWTGWIKGRMYAIHFVKKGTFGFDGSDCLAANNIGYDDDIVPFELLDVITTSQQRAVVHADGLSSSYGQFGRMILTGTNYVEA